MAEEYDIGYRPAAQGDPLQDRAVGQSERSTQRQYQPGNRSFGRAQ